MERIIEAINKSKSNKFMQESTKNFGYKLDEANTDKVNLAFDVIGDNSVKVSVAIEKLSESYADCKVNTSLQQYETRVPYGILSEFIKGIVKETQEILLNG
jgi:hypothetical protein